MERTNDNGEDNWDGIHIYKEIYTSSTHKALGYEITWELA